MPVHRYVCMHIYIYRYLHTCVAYTYNQMLDCYQHNTAGGTEIQSNSNKLDTIVSLCISELTMIVTNLEINKATIVSLGTNINKTRN